MDAATYRPFQESDAEAVCRLEWLWAREYLTYGVTTRTPADILQSVGACAYVALLGDQLIGYCLAHEAQDERKPFPLGDKYLSLDALYVKKEFRNRGIGRRLLSLVEEQAARRGVNNLYLSFEAHSPEPSRRFFERTGYGTWTTAYFKRSPSVRVYETGFLKNYRFVVIFARYEGRYLYVRHRARATWETAGGHIEPGETAEQAARRELYEETGALEFDIAPLFDYSVHTPTDFSNGQVYLAEVRRLGALPGFEMCERTSLDACPDEMTYPQILPLLFERVERIRRQNTN